MPFAVLDSGLFTDSQRLIALLLGGGVTLAIAILLGSILGWFRSPRKARELEVKLADVEKQLHAAGRTLEQTKIRHKALVQTLDEHRKGEDDLRHQRSADEEIFNRAQAELQAQQGRLAEVEKAVEALKREKTRIFAAGRRAFLNWRDSERQLQTLISQDGMSWQEPPTAPPPPFRPLEDRGAIVVAVMNLKGGVGKTTITANLAYALARKNLRVLLVDLDHQASLTGLCLSQEQIEDCRRPGGKLVNNVLAAVDNFAESAVANLVPIDALVGGFCLATSPQLLPLEERLKAQWLLRKDDRDGRFILREALHSPLIQEQFDWILIDCPPRPTAACVAALAAADRILAPSILDKVSAESLPLMLGWLRVLKANGICPDLEVLGIVGNCTHWKSKLTNREKDVWDRLQRLCADAWTQPIASFDTFIPDKGGFAEAAERHIFAASGKEIGPIFDDLVREILDRQVKVS